MGPFLAHQRPLAIRERDFTLFVYLYFLLRILKELSSLKAS